MFDEIIEAKVASECTKKVWSWDIDPTRRHRVGLLYPENPDLDLRILDDLEFCKINYSTVENSQGRCIPVCSFQEAHKLILADTRLTVSGTPHKYLEYDHGDFAIEVDIYKIINPMHLSIGYDLPVSFLPDFYIDLTEEYINFLGRQVKIKDIFNLGNDDIYVLGQYLRISYMRGWFDDPKYKESGVERFIFETLKLMA